jgi:AcrR family transcriptional regulator
VPEEASSLRERNKQRTRQAISDIATRLFIERGFDQVTIAEVATKAGVAKMTVTNHFPRKEDLVLDIQEELVFGPARVLTRRAPRESALGALRGYVLAALARCDATLGFAGPEFVGMLLGSPALRARLREIHEQRTEKLAAALIADGNEDLGARFAAAQLSAVQRVLLDEVLRRIMTGTDHETIRDQLTEPATHAFDQLEPALGGYAIR